MSARLCLLAWVVVAVAGCGESETGQPSTEGPTRTSTSTPALAEEDVADEHVDWHTYFGPTEVGYVCEFRSEDTAGVVQRKTIADVSDGGDGHLTVTVESVTTVDGTPGEPVRLPFQIDTDGSLAALPVSGSGAAARSEFHFDVGSFVVYPSIEALIAGGVQEGSVDATVDLPEPVDGRSSVHIAFEYFVRPVFRDDPLVTPAGTFENALGLESTFTSVSSDLPAEANFESAMEPLLETFGSTTWWVPGVGPARVETLMGAAVLHGCGDSPEAMGAVSEAALPAGFGLPDASATPAGPERDAEVPVNACGDFPIEGMGLVSVAAEGVGCDEAMDVMYRYFTVPSTEDLGNGKRGVDGWACGPGGDDEVYICERDRARILGSFEELE